MSSRTNAAPAAGVVHSDAVRALAGRVLGAAAERVVVGPLDDGSERGADGAPEGAAEFAYAASGGELVVRASDTPAAAAGLYHYLKHAGGRQVTWDRLRPEALTRLPDAPPTRRSTPAAARYDLNVVTTGYTAPYWDWARWEREIDWMALHGITTPLMVVGHETVLLRTFTALGLDPGDVVAWLGSAAHLPWTLMGSTSSFGGPLPDSWFERRAELGRRILERQRELGMRAVLPAFGGHVPDGLGAGARTHWQGFSTALLGPDDDAFAVVAAEFARQQRELFGTDHLYAADPFIESVPPSGEPEDLAAFAAATYAGMSAADPEATWVMQAWPFHYHRRFWTAERIAAVTDAVPRDRLLLLDLWAEHAPVWDDGRGIAEHQWLWCAVHNFGGRFSVHGDLHGLARDLGGVLDDGARTGGFTGVGMAMEALENNPVFYELLTDLVWERPDVDAWVGRFVDQRYGFADGTAARDAVHGAWAILLRTLYGPGMTRSIPSPVIARPADVVAPFHTQRLAGEFLDPDAPVIVSANIDAEADPRVEGDLPEIARAAALLREAAGSSDAGGPLAHDLADLLTHVVAQRTRAPIRAIVAAARAGDADAVRANGALLAAAIADLDAVAATQPDRLLGTWLAAAQRWADDDGERRVLLRDARRQLTVWGEQTSGLHDYSGRHWSGLLGGFYAPRWQLWVDWLAEAAESGSEPDPQELRRAVVALEESWVARDETGPTDPAGDLAALADRVLATYSAPLEVSGR
ncbi:Alpha-N-acetylglucosaminidase [Beutenbergia cavernae DSM 12333]|uniref:Alpha-N-acetylglucosaminidase n=1 Tax=Beutenbergia cavernae (strain ATCC BAA-8 / DSM 12333 / CCUG 43141 / JCM 11478 / NBRC 16432 / NCIMB 13614 / HKI 0122) TaxID=471853 RepID=C5BWA9_BEUC1|nr:alpha-N-acetylglucosaminidase [Beutenbergia cavernae]ACQ78567.1 Alpha-N-acetylglucosaminidase [Beutenbergia cavernae DSM 12333]